jgi:4-amino-4-deoxy-L-arabinose transferase-like glycosyltransferase
MGVFACAGCAALTYFIVARLVNDMAGILAALMVAENSVLHAMSVLLASSVTVTLYGLLAIAAWVCWEDAMGATRDARGIRRVRAWAIAVGALVGLTAITRPLDALCFAVPIGIAMAIAVWRDPMSGGGAAAVRPWRPVRGLAGLAGLLLIGAAPFLALQVHFNYAVTGSYLQTPFDLYAQRDYPQTTLGFHRFDPTLYPHSIVPEKRARAAARTWDVVRQHTPMNELRRWATVRIKSILADTTAHPLILALIPLGLVSLRRRQWVMAGMVVLFPIAYFFYSFFLLPYEVPVIPAMSLVAVVGAMQLQRTWPRIAGATTVLLTLGIAAICVTELPEFHRVRWAGFLAPAEVGQIESAVASLPSGRAIVMFRYAPGRSTEIEPVHNETVCWPDDARVIRAQDLGDWDIEVYRYYAKIQPDRVVYLYDRGDETMTRLGPVGELAAGPSKR